LIRYLPLTTSSGVSDFKQYCSPALKDNVYLSPVYSEESIKIVSWLLK